MCGLAGIAGDGITVKDIKIFEDLFYFSALRGPHSTGLASGYMGQKRFLYEVNKELGPSSYFMAKDSNKGNNKSQIRVSADNIYIGHCRWSTVGATTVANAHPFDTEKFLAAHNGTLYDKWSYDASGDKTDSLLMFEKMEEEGVVTVLEEMAIQSDYAITMIDKTTGKLVMTRNKGRPLYVAISDERDVIYWASEYGFLSSALERNGAKAEIFTLVPDIVYWIDTDWIKKGNVSPWLTTKLKRKPAEVVAAKVRTDDPLWAEYIQWQKASDAKKPKDVNTSGVPWDDEDEVVAYLEGPKLVDDVKSLPVSKKPLTVDQLIDEIDKLSEAGKKAANEARAKAEKAIEEAQGVTATGPVQCNFCHELVDRGSPEFMKMDCVECENGKFIYSCDDCNKIAESIRVAVK